MKIEIELSELEVTALSHFMADPQEWTENAIRERARIAVESIVQAETQRMVADPQITEIPATVEEIVAAYTPPSSVEESAPE